MKTSWRNASLVATAAFVLALTTACGQEDGSASSQNVGATQPVGGIDLGNGGSAVGSGTGTQEQEGATAQGVAAGQLAVWNSEENGKVLTDSAGFTLYRFDKDTAEPPKTTCEGDCATTWPPVPASGATAAEGIDKSLLGEVTRPDGAKQLTISGWPMYRYAKDTKSGDIKGEGVGGSWYASAPDGKKAAGGASGSGSEGDSGSTEAIGDLPGLSTRKDPELGEVVVDKNGMTVYRFDKDTPWPMKSACTGACLEKWPVVAPVDAADTKGIDNKNDGRRGYIVLNRPDGLKQQSIDCWPLYTFAGDKKPGDTNGQGVGGTWYAISPAGKPLGKPK